MEYGQSNATQANSLQQLPLKVQNIIRVVVLLIDFTIWDLDDFLQRGKHSQFCDTVLSGMSDQVRWNTVTSEW